MGKEHEMKLEELLGSELYAQVQEKLDAVNSKEPDKLKHVRYADLSEGNYVSKDKYADLETSLAGKNSELEKANRLIEELKKSTKNDEAMQSKITGYESEISNLQAENQRLKAENALKFALIRAGAQDVDYAFFKASEKLKADGKTLELNDAGEIKGIDDLIKELKTQLPTQFKSGKDGSSEDGKFKIPENQLPTGTNNPTVTREQFLKMTYQERLNLKDSNEELYSKLTKGR